MENVNLLKLIRNTLFKAFFINILIVIVCWVFVMTNLIQYFMWALPGMTLESANLYIMYLLGALDILGVILFLVPALALCCTIKCCNKKS
ncbi:MAG: hypothetical protein LBH40_02560 [Alphaproteobacteria bacterium]|nr:hypothetical protein [Alphaproteobacteria bacterium]